VTLDWGAPGPPVSPVNSFIAQPTIIPYNHCCFLRHLRQPVPEEETMKRMLFAACFASISLAGASCSPTGRIQVKQANAVDSQEQASNEGFDLVDADKLAPSELAEQELVAELPDTPEILEKDSLLQGVCSEGQSAALFFVRIADSLDNTTLYGDCGGGNPGADIDAVVLVRPDGTEYYAATVETDDIGYVCDHNDHDDINTVLGGPDGCAGELGSGCGDYGYITNPDCQCAGGTDNLVGYYSLNGGSVIVSFEQGTELLCGDQIAIFEMYNPEIAGSEETYTVSFGDAFGNFIGQTEFSTGTGVVDVNWEW
jgi:hypothetical protein